MHVLITDPGSVGGSLMRPAPAGGLSARLLWSVAHGHGITPLTHHANGATGQKEKNTHTHSTHKHTSKHAHECKFKKYTYKRTLNLWQGHNPISRRLVRNAAHCVRPFHLAASVCAGLGRLSLRLGVGVPAKEGLSEKRSKELSADTQPNSRD